MPYVSANGLQLYYEMHGSGPRCLVILGSGSDLRHTPNIFSSPLTQHFEVLAYDQRGQGRSDTPDGPYTMADYADDARALLDVVGWECCAVLGISFGGMVAQEFALRHPDVIERLLLACTSSGGAGGASFALHDVSLEDTDTLQEILAGVFDVRMASTWPFPSSRKERIPRRLQVLLSRTVEDLGDPEKQAGFARQLGARMGHDTFSRLPAMTCPTLVCAGTHDGIAPPLNQFRMARQIPDAELVFYEGGHLFYLDDRKAFPEMIAFLRGQRPLAAGHFTRGYQAYIQDRYDEAVRHFKQAVVDASPGQEWHDISLFFMGECHRIDGRISDALAAWKQMEQTDPNGVIGALARSQLALYEEQDNRRALEELDEAIVFEPDWGLLRQYRADVLERMQKWDDAIAGYSDAIERCATDAVSFQNRSYVLCAKEQYESALVDCDEALRLMPWYPEASLLRAQILRNLGRAQDAIHELDTLLLTHHTCALTWVERAFLRMQNGQWENAMTDFEQALSADPDNINAYIGRAELRLREGDYTRAIEDFNEAISRDAGQSKLYYKRGFAHHKKGALPMAISDYSEALCRDYEAIEALNNRGMAYKQSGQIDAAMNDFCDAINRNSSHAFAFNNRGLIYMLRNDFSSAISDFSTAYNLQADHDFLFNRACAHEEYGQLQEAIEDFTNYIKVAGADDAESIKRRVEALEARQKENQ